MPKKILVVEDTAALARALQVKLKLAGFEAETSPNGQEALLFLEKNNVDLIILDMIMPLKNGFEVLEELHGRGNKVPVLVLSNLTREEELKKVLTLGAAGYFLKVDMQLSGFVEYVTKLINNPVV